ncbi:IclR family transcriptional regulator [Plantactinospora soyae]|uniref:DNA-binding IclR family transcriptional regulator n=1 Tax=Plantactinospora soyae TaxID=1544732 RepID=A0A927QZ17_9ACTN|nr:IclR family transcriptional regulator [Plantactinospora soyae]MBE1489870.1 DNA-binding IclR family transcriptional regulator [Plantactinospora soyae]
MSQTVERALSIIEFFAERPRSLGEVAEHLGVHKSTALRLLQTLERAGFARSVDGRYTVGFRMVAIAHQAVEHLELHPVAQPHLVRLGDRYGHTVHLAQLVDDEIVYLAKVDGRGALKMRSRVGRAVNPHTSGVGKAILAHLDESSRERFLARLTYQRHTATSITSPAAFRAELARIAERGWAEDDGEFEDFVNCVAAPVRDARGRVVAAVSITALRAVAPLDQLRELLPQLTETCAAISRDLGWTGDQRP